MRALIPVACLMLCGCALLFRDGTKELGVIPREPGTNVVIRTVLRRDTLDIWFSCATNVQTGNRVTVALTNTSAHRTISVARENVAPHTVIRLFDGSLSDLLDGRRFAVTTWSGRAGCELHVYFSSAPWFPAPVRVLSHYSSPPL